MPSTISLTRPESSRAVSCRSRPSTGSRLRMRGMMTACTATISVAIRPSQKLCSRMNTSAVSAWPPSSAGETKASPVKPPSGSTSSLIIVAISAGFTLLKWLGGKRRTRSTSSKRIRRSKRSPSRPLKVLM
ncbi:hypothetical protein D9M72_567260 [compost metagenome]